MNTLKFRHVSPIRTYLGPEKRNYRSYKIFLRTDFGSRCGYTHCSDHWFGGTNNFHIDHFKSYLLHPHLKTTYSNLVYCCSYVNIAKSSNDSDYLDPCDFDYNEHFYRNENGEIIPFDDSIIAKTMYKDLKLYLKRYSVIWILEQLEQRIEKLDNLITSTSDASAKELYYEITCQYFKYLKYLRANL